MPRFRPKIAKIEAQSVHQAQPQKTSKNPTKAGLKKNGAVCKVLRGRSTGQKTQRPAKTTNAKHHRDENVTIRRVTRHDPDRDALAPVGWRNLGPNRGVEKSTCMQNASVLLYRQTGPQANSPKPQKTRSPTSAKNTEKQEK